MGERLEIFILGGLRIHFASKPVRGLASRKANALLAYLAAEGGAQSREVLADLLWDGFSQQRAMANLRVVLASLRRALGPFLHISRDSVELPRSEDVWIDVVDLECCLAEGQLEEALAHYRGDFLHGFHIPRANKFSHWATIQRERLRQSACRALMELVDLLSDQGLIGEAIPYAQRLLEFNPLMDSAHRRMMRLFAQTDQRELALEQYQRCEEILQEELGIEPSEETRALRDQIETGSLHPGIKRPEPRYDLPARLTSFIGRQREIAEIATLLSNPDHRLLTILGPGGVGKSRLAVEFAEANGHLFPDGIFYVSLVGVPSTDSLLPSLADSLGIELAAGGDPVHQVINQMQGKQALLLMDNFEHLLGAAQIVHRILAGTPTVKVLTTSRARLMVHGERVLNLKGLDPPRSGDEDDIEESPSVELFQECARRYQPSGLDGAGELRGIAEICRLVEGMPLAIELAASWTRLLRPSEIREEIRSGLDILRTDSIGLSARHRSIKATFDHSWTMLSDGERQVLMALSVFRGGCSLEAAQEVSGASFQQLMGLVNKSMLWRDQSGRFEMHELLRSYVSITLDAHPEAKALALERHCRYYAHFLADRENELADFRQDEALLEFRNLRASWTYACERGFANELLMMSVSLGWIFEQQGWIHEGLGLFSYGVEALSSYQGEAARRASGLALAFLGWMRTRDGDLVSGTTAIRGGLDALLPFAAARERLLCNLIALAWSDLRYGPEAETTEFIDRTLEMLSDVEPSWIGVYVNCLSASLALEHDVIDLAEERYLEARSIGAECHYQYAEPYASDGLGRGAYCRGEFPKAERYFQRSVDYHKRVGYYPRLAEVTNFLAHAALECGKHDDAYVQYQNAMSIYRKLDLWSDVAAMQADVAYFHLRLTHYNRALAALLRSLEALQQFRFPAYEKYAVAICAQWLMETGRTEEALELWPTIASQTHHPKFVRDLRIKAILAELERIAADLARKPGGRVISLAEVRDRLQDLRLELASA